MIARIALVIALLAAPAYADPDDVVSSTPPSRTLERAIKLYDKKDFYSASIELKKVLDGESGDDAKNRERAQFFQAKTFYQIGFYVPSLVQFLDMMSKPAHVYREASLKWLAAIGRVPGLHAAMPDLAKQFDSATLDQPILASVRDEIRLTLAIPSADHRAVIALLEPIPPDSPQWPRARLQLARARFALNELEPAIALAFEATRDPAIANDAIRFLLITSHANNKHALAKDRLARYATTHAAAAFATSRFAIEDRGVMPKLALAPVVPTEALIVATACFGGPTDDVFATIDFAVERQIDSFLQKYDDNAELYEAMRRVRDGSPSPSKLFLWFVLDDPQTREMFLFEAELAKELKLLEDSDKAWQTTQTAAELLQELVIQTSIAQATLGKLMRDRLTGARRDLAILRDATRDRTAKLAVGPTATPGHGFVVTDDACRAVHAPPRIASTAGGSAQAVPAVTPGHGCGCGSSALPGGALALLLLLPGRRRATS